MEDFTVPRRLADWTEVKTVELEGHASGEAGQDTRGRTASPLHTRRAPSYCGRCCWRGDARSTAGTNGGTARGCHLHVGGPAPEGRRATMVSHTPSSKSARSGFHLAWPQIFRQTSHAREGWELGFPRPFSARAPDSCRGDRPVHVRQQNEDDARWHPQSQWSGS